MAEIVRSLRENLGVSPSLLLTHRASALPAHLQACFSVLIFILLSSQDGFQTEWKEDEHGVLRAPAIYNGALSWDAASCNANAALVVQAIIAAHLIGPPWLDLPGALGALASIARP